MALRPREAKDLCSWRELGNCPLSPSRPPPPPPCLFPVSSFPRAYFTCRFLSETPMTASLSAGSPVTALRVLIVLTTVNQTTSWIGSHLSPLLDRRLRKGGNHFRLAQCCSHSLLCQGLSWMEHVFSKPLLKEREEGRMSGHEVEGKKKVSVEAQVLPGSRDPKSRARGIMREGT